MSDDVARVAGTAADSARMLAGVLPLYHDRAEGLVGDIRAGLGR